MGTWGAAIFADDDASDVKADFRHFLADAQSLEGATEAIVEDYGASFTDLGSTTAFWLGLGLTQWRMGRLDPRVKEAVLAIIDRGLDLAKWEGSPDRGKRAAALVKARAQILSSPPAPSPMPKPFAVQLGDWKIGEVIGYRTRTGGLALLHVTRFSRCTQLKVKAPAVSFLHWLAGEMPGLQDLAALTDLKYPLAPSGIQVMARVLLAVPAKQPLDQSRFLRPGLLLDLLLGEQLGAGMQMLADGTHDLDSIVDAALKRWRENPDLSPKALPPWMTKGKPAA